ncbi:MAG: hypothetical protein RLY43_397 [Bacteroidota bacterium]|jgi:hypothetical protein
MISACSPAVLFATAALRKLENYQNEPTAIRRLFEKTYHCTVIGEEDPKKLLQLEFNSPADESAFLLRFS